MTNEAQRIEAASLLRELGHEFVGRVLDDAQLDELSADVLALLARLRDAPIRVREISRQRTEEFNVTIPTIEEAGQTPLFSDSFVAGGANPLGLAAQLWREGTTACMQVTLGKPFEGAPGRAHGGVVAALLDETMGLLNVLHGEMAFTATLEISYQAPTPIGEPIIARAWLARRDGRKHVVEATLHAGELLVASANGLFITIDRSIFLDQLLVDGG